MAIDFVCGFECRIVTAGATPIPDERHWSVVTSTPTISTSTVRSGTAALRCLQAGAAMALSKNLARTIVAGRIYIRFADFPATQDVYVRMVNASGTMNIEVDAAGVVTAFVGTGADSPTIATLSLDTWYRVDWVADTSGATSTLKVRVDGGAEQTASNVQATADMTNVRLGCPGTVTSDVFYDDMILGTALVDYPFGAGTVERMKPTRDGTHSFTAADFGYNTAGGDVATSATDVWSFLDHDDLTAITELIRQKTVRTTGYVEVGFGTAPFTHDALGVMVVGSFHASTTGANTCGLKMNDGGSLSNLTDAAGDALSDFSQTTVVFFEKMVLAPPSGGTWTKAKIDALLMRWGYSGDVVGIPYWDGLMLEVAYAPAPAATFVPYRNPMYQLLAH